MTTLVTHVESRREHAAALGLAHPAPYVPGAVDQRAPAIAQQPRLTYFLVLATLAGSRFLRRAGKPRYGRP